MPRQPHVAQASFGQPCQGGVGEVAADLFQGGAGFVPLAKLEMAEADFQQGIALLVAARKTFQQLIEEAQGRFEVAGDVVGLGQPTRSDSP